MGREPRGGRDPIEWLLRVDKRTVEKYPGLKEILSCLSWSEVTQELNCSCGHKFPAHKCDALTAEALRQHVMSEAHKGGVNKKQQEATGAGRGPLPCVEVQPGRSPA